MPSFFLRSVLCLGLLVTLSYATLEGEDVWSEMDDSVQSFTDMTDTRASSPSPQALVDTHSEVQGSGLYVRYYKSCYWKDANFKNIRVTKEQMCLQGKPGHITHQ